MREIALSLTFFILITLSLLYIGLLHLKLRSWSRNFLKIKKDYLTINRSNDILQKKVYKLRNRLIKEKKTELHLKDRIANRLKSGLMIVSNELEKYKSNGDESYLVKVGSELSMLIQNSNSLIESHKNHFLSQKDSERIRLNLSQFTAHIIAQYRDGAKLKRTKLNAMIEDNIFIKEEPGIIAIIINNLLSNALKFTGLAPGKRERAVKVILKSSIYKVFITIIDSGPGFAAAPESNGLRLGLKITRSAIESIGGKLTIISQPGRGTECNIMLKKNAAPDHKTLTKTPSLPKSYLNPIDLDRLPELYPHRKSLPNILVVSLEECLIRLITDYLHWDFNVAHAMTPLMAIDKLSSIENIALIILDLPLQSSSASELLKIVAEEYPQTVLVITNSREDNIKFNKTLSKLTTIIYARKPFSIEELHRKLKVFFQKSQNISAKAITTTLTKSCSDLEIFARTKRLTSREKDILRYIIEGKTLKETARELAISIETVKKYRQKLFSKLEVKSAREIFPKYFR